MSLCFRTVKATRWPGYAETTNGKPKLYFDAITIDQLTTARGPGEQLELPCGKCIGCKLHRASEWSLRCMHEARYWDRKSFLTLTYATPKLPPHRSLCKRDFQTFMKRLRKRLRKQKGIKKTKYFMVGEYGENRSRPHYHAILYGYDFPDRELCKNNPDALHPLYQSKELDEVWGNGICKVGDVTADSCNYVARYTMKKVGGEEGKREYLQTQRIPPYNACSKGFGARYFSEYSGDCFPSDYLIHEDSKTRVPIPRYYDKLYQRIDAEAFEYVKLRRIDNAKHAAIRQAKDRTPERMKVREEILLRKAKRLGRRYEEDRSQHPGPEGP